MKTLKILYADKGYKPSEIDKKIKPLVAVLQHKGYKTHASCQGGPRHSTPYPWILIDKANIKDIRELVKAHKTKIKWEAAYERKFNAYYLQPKTKTNISQKLIGKDIIKLAKEIFKGD